MGPQSVDIISPLCLKITPNRKASHLKSWNNTDSQMYLMNGCFSCSTALAARLGPYCEACLVLWPKSGQNLVLHAVFRVALEDSSIYPCPKWARDSILGRVVYFICGMRHVGSPAQ